MKNLQSVLVAGTTIDNLISAYRALGDDYVNGHTVDGQKYPPAKYPHLYDKADAIKAVYDAARAAQEAAKALDDANTELILKLRELRRYL